MSDLVLLYVLLFFSLCHYAGRQWLTKKAQQHPIEKQIYNPAIRLQERALQILWLLLFIFSFGLHVPIGVFATMTPFRYAGLVLYIGAIVLQQVTKWQLGSNWTNAARGATAREGPITVHGLYRWSRNPMYCGTMLMTFAFVLILQNFPSLVLSLLTYLYVLRNIKNEERLLLDVKGESYLQYLETVPRFF